MGYVIYVAIGLLIGESVRRSKGESGQRFWLSDGPKNVSVAFIWPVPVGGALLIVLGEEIGRVVKGDKGK